MTSLRVSRRDYDKFIEPRNHNRNCLMCDFLLLIAASAGSCDTEFTENTEILQRRSHATASRRRCAQKQKSRTLSVAFISRSGADDAWNSSFDWCCHRHLSRCGSGSGRRFQMGRHHARFVRPRAFHPNSLFANTCGDWNRLRPDDLHQKDVLLRRQIRFFAAR